jgi:hypothetical protein
MRTAKSRLNDVGGEIISAPSEQALLNGNDIMIKLLDLSARVASRQPISFLPANKEIVNIYNALRCKTSPAISDELIELLGQPCGADCVPAS